MLNRATKCYSTIIAANREYNARVIVIQTPVKNNEASLKQQYYQL